MCRKLPVNFVVAILFGVLEWYLIGNVNKVKKTVCEQMKEKQQYFAGKNTDNQLITHVRA